MALETLNFFDIFVNMLGGSVFIGFLLVLGIILLIGYLTRLSQTFMLFWGLVFTLSWGMVFYGGIVPAAIFVFAFAWFAYSMYKYVTGGAT